MKIGIMGTRGIPNNYGGFEQFAQFLSEGLYKRGHDVSVYNSSDHPYREKIWNGVHIIHCKDREHQIGTAGQFFYDLNCIKDARKKNFDVLLHLGYTSDSCWWRRWPKNTINIMNMDGMEWKRSKYNWLTRKFLKGAESLAARKAQVLIADSTAIQHHILKTYHREATFIPYAAQVFTEASPFALEQFDFLPQEYFLLIARMEPENNIEMIIKGYLHSGHHYSLIVIGSTANKFGQYLVKKYGHLGIKFIGPVYDQYLLNNLRFYSLLYFHGHSVGGTNPSLLEAMACGCNIAAHDNTFNKAILQNEASYFSTDNDIASIINKPKEVSSIEKNKQLNIEKIETIYNPEVILDKYEELALKQIKYQV